MKKAPIGTIVYAKRHALFFHTSQPEQPRTIMAHVRKRTGNIVAQLDSGELVRFGDLTDIPCSQMQCGNCKWHHN